MILNTLSTMKKFIYFLLAPVFLCGCGHDDETSVPADRDGGEAGTGTIVIASGIDIEVEPMTRTSTDPTTYTLKIDGPSGPITTPVPESGKIRNLKPGTYTVTLTSHPDGSPDPAFDNPVYSVTVDNVKIKANQHTPVELKCEQVNAGVFFEYDQSLTEAGMMNLVPTVTQGVHALVYQNDKKQARGYFDPGTVTVTMKNAGEDVPIEGAESKDIILDAKQLWKVRLYVSETRAGQAGLSYKVTMIR